MPGRLPARQGRRARVRLRDDEAVADWRQDGRAGRRGRRSRPATSSSGSAATTSASCRCWKNSAARPLVVQFDAHLDVYAFHDTTAELSHGNFLHALRDAAAAARQRRPPRPVPDARRIAQTFEAAYSAVDVAATPDRVLAELRAKAGGAKRVWIDLDCDAFDPAALPAVQQPLPFGLAAPVFLKLFEAVWSEKVVGAVGVRVRPRPRRARRRA